MGTQETGQVTGTKDKDYNVIWFAEQCVGNATIPATSAG